ncbi:hydrolase 1, exosortase A system-associated [Undibacterium sp.]|uniref:hydrolase 1, exosortase A system-associated n=1 Tax=Undibacterium sp. TaxID=1914977 RepID=UPI00374C89B8
MAYTDTALSFHCKETPLYGVLSMPRQAQPAATGVLVIVGGPQYRAGSHRQFTLLARHLAERGIPVMRFDYRGMGDSEGEPASFENVNDDIRAALDEFFTAVPGLHDVVLWGLCDAASAALFYAPQDPRVTAVVLLNPWVRTEQGEAKAYLKHYYKSRLMEAELWEKVLSGRFNFSSAVKSLAGLIGKLILPKKPDTSEDADQADASVDSLPDRMQQSLALFSGRVLIITAGKDLTAQEFSDVASSSAAWKSLLASPRISSCDLADADHTFSRRAWRDQVAAWTADWVGQK